METNQIKEILPKKHAKCFRRAYGINWHCLIQFRRQCAGKKYTRRGGDHIVFMGRVITDMSFYTKWTALRTRIEEKKA